jgi:hypothetical protein
MLASVIYGYDPGGRKRAASIGAFPFPARRWRLCRASALARSEGTFPVIPVEPGISSIFPVQPPFGRENGEVNQSLASEFPMQPEPGIRLAQPGIKSAEPGILWGNLEMT